MHSVFHGVGGTLGAILTGVFATKAVTGLSFDPDTVPRVGLLEGDSQTLINQLVSIGATAVIAVVGTLIILLVLKATMGLRVSVDAETQGLDLSQHGEEGYIFL